MVFHNALTAVLLSLIVALVASNDRILGSSSLRDLVNLGDQDLSRFLSSSEEPHQGQARQFGDRCGTLFGDDCAAGFECDEVSLGRRCLPNECLQEHSDLITQSFNVDDYKTNLYNDAGYTEDEIFAKLAEVRDERKFLETDEFRALQAALHANLEPLEKMVQLSNTCVGPVNNTVTGKQESSVSYIGLHIEAGAIIDASLQYLVATNGDDQRSILRLCLGAELGVGAEISYVFGFTDTALTEDMLCGAAMADVDVALIFAAGAAVGIQFNGVFFYEFTFGGGLGFGIGGALCANLQYGNATIAAPTTAPTTVP